MKKFALLLFVAIVSNGQIKAQESGNTLLGGNFSFLSESKKTRRSDESELNLSISPVIGRMVNDKVAIGVALGFVHSKIEQSNNQNSYTAIRNALVLAPFIRIHNNITESFKFYIEPNLGKTFELGDETDNKTQIYNAGINFGLLYFISQKLSLELNVASINYVRISNKGLDWKRNTFSIDYDLATPNIGLKYYL